MTTRRSPWVGVALVLGVALAASVAGLRNTFVQDDVVLIAENLRIHQLANWWQMVSSPFWPPPWSQDLYRPLTTLLLAVEYALGGGAPLLFRVVSYALYVASAVAVLLLARRTLPPPVALGVALLFAAHPVHVEAVALGVAQNEVLVGLLAALMTVRYLDARRDGRLPPVRDWAVLGGLYLAAALTKESGLVLPALLVGAEACLFATEGGGRWRRLVPGYVALAVLGTLVLAVRTIVLSGIGVETFKAEQLLGLGIGARALTMLQVVPIWLRLLLWPAHLQADFAPQELVAPRWFGGPEALGLLLLVGLIALGWLCRRRMPVVAFGLTWTAVALLPVSNILVPTGILVADRTLFLPSIGMLIAVGGLVTGLLAGIANPRARSALCVACGVVIVLGVMRSAERHRVWRDETVFSIQGAEDAPKSYRMQLAAGYALFQAGERDRALEAYGTAVARAPSGNVWRVRNDLARRFWEAGENRLAQDQLLASLAAAPDREETWRYVVLGYMTLGEYAEASRIADSALARGGARDVFAGLKAESDSAARVGAPPGSIRLRIVRPDRQ